jgi:hypothetical protein
MRCFITDFKKELIFGDCYYEDGWYSPCIGARIKVKILGMFWVTYKQFKK